MKTIRIFVSILLFSCFISILAQESPYSIFGDKTPTLGMHISDEDCGLSGFKCVAFLKDGSVGFVEFDFKAKIAKMKDSKGNELQQTNITPSDIARFTTPDPKTELYSSISPYVYCAGKPIRFIDPTEMALTTPVFIPWASIQHRLSLIEPSLDKYCRLTIIRYLTHFYILKDEKVYSYIIYFF